MSIKPQTFIIIALLFSYPISLLAQTSVSNFHISDQTVFWQKVFETNLTKEEIVKGLKATGHFENYQITENELMASMKAIPPLFKGSGYSRAQLPIYIGRSDIIGFIHLEIKESRYRVTIKNIEFVQAYDDAVSKSGEKTQLSTFAIKSSSTDFKKSFIKSPSKVLDFTFTNLFTIKKMSDW